MSFKQENKKNLKLNSIASKLELAIENPDLAYEKLMQQKAEGEQMIKSTDERMKNIGQGKINDATMQLKIVTEIMKHKTALDMGKDFLIPAVAGIEGKAKGFIKGMSGGLFGTN